MGTKEDENVKLFKHGGPNAITSTATFGVYILAAAVDHGQMVQSLDNLLTAKWNNRLVEPTNRPDEIGKAPRDLKPDVLPISTEARVA